MPKFANAMDLLEVAAAGCVPMLEFPPDYDMTPIVDSIRMMRQLDELNRVLDMCKVPETTGFPGSVYAPPTTKCATTFTAAA